MNFLLSLAPHCCRRSLVTNVVLVLSASFLLIENGAAPLQRSPRKLSKKTSMDPPTTPPTEPPAQEEEPSYLGIQTSQDCTFSRFIMNDGSVSYQLESYTFSDEMYLFTDRPATLEKTIATEDFGNDFTKWFSKSDPPNVGVTTLSEVVGPNDQQHHQSTIVVQLLDVKTSLVAGALHVVYTIDQSINQEGIKSLDLFFDSTVDRSFAVYTSCSYFIDSMQQNSGAPAPQAPVVNCAADYGSTEPCCGQEGTGTVGFQYSCNSDKPTCIDYVYDRHWGKCTDDTYLALQFFNTTNPKIYGTFDLYERLGKYLINSNFIQEDGLNTTYCNNGTLLELLNAAWDEKIAFNTFDEAGANGVDINGINTAVDNVYNSIIQEIDTTIVGDIVVEDAAEATATAAAIMLACWGWLFVITVDLTILDIAAMAIAAYTEDQVTKAENSVALKIANMGSAAMSDSAFESPELKAYIQTQDDVTTKLSHWYKKGDVPTDTSIPRIAIQALAHSCDSVNDMMSNLTSIAFVFQNSTTKLAALEYSYSITTNNQADQEKYYSKMKEALTTYGVDDTFYGLSWNSALPGMKSTLQTIGYVTSVAKDVLEVSVFAWKKRLQYLLTRDGFEIWKGLGSPQLSKSSAAFLTRLTGPAQKATKVLKILGKFGAALGSIVLLISVIEQAEVVTALKKQAGSTRTSVLNYFNDFYLLAEGNTEAPTTSPSSSPTAKCDSKVVYLCAAGSLLFQSDEQCKTECSSYTGPGSDCGGSAIDSNLDICDLQNNQNLYGVCEVIAYAYDCFLEPFTECCAQTPSCLGGGCSCVIYPFNNGPGRYGCNVFYANNDSCCQVGQDCEGKPLQCVGDTWKFRRS